MKESGGDGVSYVIGGRVFEEKAQLEIIPHFSSYLTARSPSQLPCPGPEPEQSFIIKSLFPTF
jgi:hypothetical protein